MIIDDQMKVIFLLCSLPSLWDTFYTVIDNSSPDGKLVYNDVTSQLLSKEMRQKTRDTLHHGKSYYVQKDDKQQRGHLKQRDSRKDNQRDSSRDRPSSCECFENT